MSQHLLQIKRIESLDSNSLANVLQFNGYEECAAPIRLKDINGENFLNLTEVQISLWRLPMIQSRRLWSFIQQVKLDPNQLVLPQNSKSANNTLKKSAVNFDSNAKQNEEKPLHTVKSIKSTSLTKEESFLFKNKLEGMFKKESVENKSFVHQQKYPKLPPKPFNLKTNDTLKNIQPEQTVEEDDDDYLEPIARQVETETNVSTFLSKYRRDSGPPINDIQVNVRDTKIKSIKNRPLPPLPPVKIADEPVSKIDHYEESDEDVRDRYMPVLETEEKIPAYLYLEDEFISGFKRPLPPIPPNSEIIPEYAPVIEEVVIKPAIFRQPPPPEPYFKSDSNTRKSASLSNRIKSTSFKLKDLNLASQQKFKSPTTLPKPPIDLPSLPTPFLPNTSKPKLDPPLPPPRIDVEDSSDEDESIDEDLQDVPCYRETDRKGAKMLLNGLEEGAFVIRPSRQNKYVCTLSIMHSKKMFNLGIEQGDDGMLVFSSTTGEIKQPAFYMIKDLVEHYMIYPLHLYGEYITLKNVLPLNKR